MLIGTLSLGFSARLNLRFGAQATLVPGLVLVLAALLWFARVPVDGSYFFDVFPAMVLLGAGGGLAFPSLTTLAMSGATPSESGLASGVVNTSLQVGGAFGLALLASLAMGRTGSLRAGGEQAAAALTGGYHLAFLIAAGLVAAAIGLAVAVLRPEHVAAEQVREAARLRTAPQLAYAEAA